MELTRVCHICLVMDVKMQNLQIYPWNLYWEPIFEVNPLGVSELPSYACFECAALLKRNYRFREKCLLGQSVLQTILQTNGKVTPDLINQINRKDMNLESSLKAFSVINISYPQSIEVDVSVVEVKNEPDDIVMEVLDNCQKDVKFLKEEGFEDFPDFGALSSDDDEPLSLHKSKKETKVKVKKKNKKIKKQNEETTVEVKNQNEISAPIQLPEEIPIQLTEETLENLLSQSEPAPEKKKRGRRKKTETESGAGASETKRSRRTNNTGGVAVEDDVDLEEFVTIIKLTEEEQLEEIRKRQHSSNYLNAPFQCNLCYKGFIDTDAWRHHVGKHDPSAGDIECVVCKFRFVTRRALQKHAANHEKKYACKSCAYVSKTTTQAKQHQRWHKGVTYKCQYCDEVLSKWTSYLSHVRIKHPSEFICGVCGYSFVSKLGLTMHRTMMHKDLPPESTETCDDGDARADVKPGPYCAACDVQFVSLEAYKRHTVTSAKHASEQHFKSGCRVCGESFQSAEELRAHHRREHARKRPKNYGKKPTGITWPAQCEHCPKTIESARDYWTHFRRAHPDKSYPIQKDYVCDICGKSFRGNAFLTYHKRTHSSERNYKCAQCPKAFYNRTNLQMHEKTHSDHRPYPCGVCLKAFKCKGALDRHYRSHTGVKPYECEVCGKAFGQSNSRKLHVRTVHLRQPAPYVSRARQERRRQAGTTPALYE